MYQPPKSFIKLYGLLAFLTGGVVAAVGVVGLIVSAILVATRRFSRWFGSYRALVGPTFAITCGIIMMLAAEYDWLDAQLLDELFWVCPLIAVMGWFVLIYP